MSRLPRTPAIVASAGKDVLVMGAAHQNIFEGSGGRSRARLPPKLCHQSRGCIAVLHYSKTSVFGVPQGQRQGSAGNVMQDNKSVVICSHVMQSVKDNLLAAFRYLLKPLVRMAMKNGVSFPDFSEALKKAFVDVAARQLASSERDVSEEGISLITNIEARDVRAMLHTGADADYGREAQEAAPLAVVLSAWHTDPAYTGPYGVLRDLEFEALTPPSNRSSPTLTDLVRTYCPGVAAQSILDELMRLGAVEEVGNGFFRAVRRSYVADSLSKQNIIYMSRVVHNICETLERNLRPTSAGEKGLIERTISTQYGISKRDHVAFDKFIREKGQAFSDDVDNWLTARDVEGISDGVQVGVGFYHYIVNEDDESALNKDFPK